MADALSFLVINVSRIGDTLLATPAIRAIARAYLDARIDALCHPKRAEILEHLPLIGRVGTITKHAALARPYPCATDVPMAEIPVETVLAAVLRALADHPPSATAS